VKSELVTAISAVARAQWNGLLEPEDSPFVDWDWLYALEKSGCASAETGWAPHHVLIRANGGELVGACPLYVKTHSMGEFVFDHGWAQAAARAGLEYFPKLLVGVPFTPHTGRRLLVRPGADPEEVGRLLGRALLTLRERNRLSSVHVNFCLPQEARLLLEMGFLERLGYQYHWHNEEFRSFEDYLGALKHKRRHAIRKEQAELRAQAIDIRIAAGAQIDDGLLRAMFDIYRSTIDKLYWGRQYLNPSFFKLMRDFKRNLVLVCAYENNELIAGTFNVQHAGVMYGRYWGCFRERNFLHFNVCYYAAIEHCIRTGLRRFEPGAGGEYKWLRGFDPALTRSVHYLAHPGLARAVGDFLRRERQEVESWITVGQQHGAKKAPPPSNREPD